MNNFFDDFLKKQRELESLLPNFKDIEVNRIMQQINSITKDTPDFNNLISLPPIDVPTAEQLGITKIDNSIFTSLANKNIIDPQLPDFLKEFLSENNSVISQITAFDKWQSTFDNLINTNQLNMEDNIPDSLYQSLIDLNLQLEKNKNIKTASSDIPVEITVNKPDTLDSTNQSFNWGNFIAFIALVIAINAYSLQSNDSDLSSKYYEKHLEEERKQTELIQEQLEEEKKQTELMQERLELEKQELENNEEFYSMINQLLEESINIVQNEKPSNDTP